MVLNQINIKDTKCDIGKWAKLLRKKHNLSQDQLAEMLSLSRITIQHLEGGKNITLDTFLKVLQHFDELARLNFYIQNEIKNNIYASMY
jgi:transcriptional regulator with XRE-family HTH domain